MLTRPKSDSSVGLTTNSTINEDTTSIVIEVRWEQLHSLHGVKVIFRTKMDAVLFGATLKTYKDLREEPFDGEHDGERTWLLYAANPKGKLTRRRSVRSIRWKAA
jgi:hypothetical protein